TIIQLPFGLPSAYNLTDNNNAYFGTTGVNIGATSGTLTTYTFADFNPSSISPSTNWRSYTSTLLTANTNNDNASFATTDAAPFTSSTNLHIPNGTQTLVESGGANLSGTVP